MSSSGGTGVEFACNLIGQSYEDLILWARPHNNYTQVQKENLSGPFQHTMIFSIYFMFMGWPPTAPGVDLLKRQFDLQLDTAKLKQRAKPLLTEAFKQVNKSRVAQGLPPFDYDYERQQPLQEDE